MTRYQAFCRQIASPYWPVTEKHLCRYACYLSRNMSTVAAISNYLQGIKNWLMIQGISIEAFSGPRLRLLLRGLRRQKQHLVRQALPINPQILTSLYPVARSHGLKGLVFWTTSLLAFFLTSRKSNLVPNSPQSFDPSKHLTRADISVHHNHLIVTFRWSKTIQYGQRVISTPVKAIPNSVLCPVRAYSNMVRLIPAQASQPAFLYPHRSSFIPFSYWQWMTLLKASISKIGLDSALYSTHSFRRGGATFAFESGVPVQAIKVMGDWASEAVNQYIQVPAQVKWAAASRITEAIQNVSSLSSRS